MSHKIYVGNLSFRSDKSSLQDHFKDCGEMLEVHIVMDRATGRSKGFGFVTFAEESAVEAALQLSGKELDGRPLRIDRATGEAGGAPRSGGNRPPRRY